MSKGQPIERINETIDPVVYGEAARPFYLPFYKRVQIPKSTLEQIPVIPTLVSESCGLKIITGAFFGSVMGVAMGLFIGAMGDNSPIQVINGREVPQAPLREQIRAGFKGTASKTYGWAKSFGVLTALFGGVECLIEKYRAKHDIWNPVVTGCVVGGTMSAKGGPAAVCMGCIGFAGFSLVMEKIMGQ